MFFVKNVTCIIEFKISKSKGDFYEKILKLQKMKMASKKVNIPLSSGFSVSCVQSCTIK